MEEGSGSWAVWPMPRFPKAASSRLALSSEINPEADDNNLWLDDIENAYQYLWTIYGPFTSSGLDEEAQKAIQADPEWMEFAAKMKAFYEHVEDTFASLACLPVV